MKSKTSISFGILTLHLAINQDEAGIINYITPYFMLNLHTIIRDDLIRLQLVHVFGLIIWIS